MTIKKIRLKVIREKTDYKTPELLAPVQDLTSLKAAIQAGADAIYFGIKGLNMRAGAKNFELKDINKVISTAHKAKVKAYLTLNVIIYDNELKRVETILKNAKKYGIDAVICWDFSVIELCNKLNIPIHLSTQSSISNFAALKAIKSKFKNIKRVTLARELSLDQIKHIIKNINTNKLNIEVETFIHGAMCVSVSGRCFLSQEVFGKSANRGECLQPCRRKFIVKDPEEKHEFAVGEDYVLSPKDLCTIEILDKLIDANINSFKIEGRNRSQEYVKVAVESYREFIDYYLGLNEINENKSMIKNSNDKNIFLNSEKIEDYKIINGKKPMENKSIDKSLKIKSNKKVIKNLKINKRELKNLKTKLIKKLSTVYNRGFSTGFYLGKPIDAWSKTYGSKATKKKQYVGIVKNFYKKPMAAEIKVESNTFKLKDTIMFQGPTTGVFEQKVESIQLNNRRLTKAEKGKNIAIKTKKTVRKNDKVYVLS